MLPTTPKRDLRIASVFVIARASQPDSARRCWESVIPREEIEHLLREHRLLDLLARLEEAKAQFPDDLELRRSIGVIQGHCGFRSAATS